MNDTPIGTVCAFAGQVSPVSGKANEVWPKNSGCGSSEPKKGEESSHGPVMPIEASGWMLCDGRWLSVAAYDELHATLGFLYGEGSDPSGRTFRIPDYRGLFLRGSDAGAGMDPQVDERINPVGLGKLNSVGSLQCDAFEDHSHNYDAVSLSAPAQEGKAASTTTTSKSTSKANGPARSGPETRPKNIAVNYLIKFR